MLRQVLSQLSLHRRNCVACAVVLILNFAVDPRANAQGFGGGGMGGLQNTPRTQPLKIVIMLGPDYDFSKKPFTDATIVMKEYSADWTEFKPPTLGSIVVDIETPIPSTDEVFVIASYPPEATESELAKLKKVVQLNALRFGIHRIEMVPRSDDPTQGTAIWLRVPYGLHANDDPFASGAGILKFTDVAIALAESYPEVTLNTQARIDVFQSHPSKRNPSGGIPFGVGGADPFGGPGGDPFGGSPKNADPFGAPANNLQDSFGGSPQSDDPFGRPTKRITDPSAEDPFGPGPSVNPKQAKTTGANPIDHDQLAKRVEQLRQQRNHTREKIELFLRQARETQANGSPKLDDAAVRQLLLRIVSEDLKLLLEQQQLEIQQLEAKLVRLRQRLEERSQRDAQESITRARVEQLLRKP